MQADSRPPFRVMLRMEIHPGKEQEFEETWRQVATGIAREPANRGQKLLRSVEDKSVYHVLTDWTDEPSFRAFELSEAHVENRRRLQPFRRGGEMAVTETVHELPPASAPARHETPLPPPEEPPPPGPPPRTASRRPSSDWATWAAAWPAACWTRDIP
ncbi:antibiotic biosynthesis monooxygenase [Streptomyces sp. GKU 257-1]|nr:antibiotic biosynthesis monooxygenase [Streptomyces sp. GKU 257-1]